jgi:hypothetical protein
MRGCQKATLLVLLCAVVAVFWVLFQLWEGVTTLPEGTATPLVLYTPTSTATATPIATAVGTGNPAASPTIEKTVPAAPTAIPSDTLTPTRVPATSTPIPSPTATKTQVPSPTSVPQPTVPAAVTEYLDGFVPLVASVEAEEVLSKPGGIDQGTADQLREVYQRLHETVVPPDAEEMHLAFIVYVSVLEEKCLCHLFAAAHSGDAQAAYFRDCEERATSVATEVLNSRFLPSRDAFLQAYSLDAEGTGFPR